GRVHAQAGRVELLARDPGVAGPDRGLGLLDALVLLVLALLLAPQEQLVPVLDQAVHRGERRPARDRVVAPRGLVDLLEALGHVLGVQGAVGAGGERALARRERRVAAE